MVDKHSNRSITHRRIAEEEMLGNSREKHLNHIKLLVKSWNTRCLDVSGQVRHVSLQLSKGCKYIKDL